MDWISIIIWLGCLILGIGTYTVWILYTKRHIFKFARQFNTMKFYPIIGSGLQFLGNDFFQYGVNGFNRLSIPYGAWLGHDFYYITENVDEINTILNHPDCLDKPKFYEYFEAVFGKSLLIRSANLWRTTRKFHSRSFKQSILNSLVYYFYKNSNTLLKVLEKNMDKDYFKVFGNYSFDGFCESTMGKNYNLQLNSNIKVLEHAAWVQEFGSDFTILVVACYITRNIFFRLACFLIIRPSIYLKKYISGIVREMQNEYSKRPGVDAKFPLITNLFENRGNLFTPTMIEDEVALFSLAAADTTGASLAFITTLLGMHPDIQMKVYEEVMTEIGKDRPIELVDLPKLKYVEKVILETMRLFPAIPLFSRYIGEDIDCGSTIIPKGIYVALNVFKLHRNPKFWPDPLKFDPERFSPEEIAKRQPNCYLPFSGGPRNCIGKTYAMMSMKVVVANIARHFKITSKYKSWDELELKSFITLRTKQPLDVHFSLRK